MLLRRQQPEANFEALLRATEPFETRGLRFNWIFDAARQFGPEAALAVVDAARQCASKSVVAFSIGGDELSVPTKEFRPAYDCAAEIGLHRLIHAGEIRGPGEIPEAIRLLGADGLGHGIPANNGPALMDLRADWKL